MASSFQKALCSQLRIVHSELQAASASGRLGASELQSFGRRYAAEMYLCTQQLRDCLQADAAAQGGTSEDVRTQLQQTLWAVCIWELCMIVFVGRPAVLTEALVPWWQLHLSDRRLAEQELPALEALDRPETRANFWPTVRQLAARGLPELALRLLKHHSALRAAATGGDEQMLVERLETLLELMPRLAEPELVQAQQSEGERLGQLELSALNDFKLRHQVWTLDLTALARDADAAPPGLTAAGEVASTARLLSGDEAALSAACDSWHSKLIAKLLYQQPTTLRWQLREVLEGCLSAEERRGLDAFSTIFLDIFSDDPYATLRSIRAAFGDGWLPAHLWDLMWRAEAVGVDLMEGTPGLDVRSYLLLQHAKALGSCEPLWQLSALYATDLLDPSSGAAAPFPAAPFPAAPWGGAGRTGRLPSAARAVGAGGAEALSCLRGLVDGQKMPMHAVKLRKLLALCEEHGLEDEARNLLARAAAAKRDARRAAAAPATAAAVTQAPAAASAGLVSTPGFAVVGAGAGLSTLPPSLAPLLALASAALEEAVDAAAASASDGGGAATGDEGRAMAELRATLRSEGMGGGQYYVGPPWLPSYFALLGHIAAPQAAAAATSAAASASAAVGPPPARQAAALVVAMASSCGDSVGDGLPDVLMLLLLRFFAGVTRHASAHEAFLFGRPGPDAAPTFSVADTHTLIGQWETVKAAVLNTAPAEGANSRAHELRSDEREVSLALSKALAIALMHEAAAPSKGTCWGAGLAVSA